MSENESEVFHRRSCQTHLVAAIAAMLIIGCVVICPHGNFVEDGVTPQFWMGIGLMSLGFILTWRLRAVGGYWFWAIALATRLILLPMHPGDDIWRYLWEGYIQTVGFSPFHLSPLAPELAPYRTEWWSLINHPTVSAIYPPLTQLGFRGLAAIAPSVLIFKVGFVGADIGVCWLLSRRFGYRKALIYAWNPLILYSFAGGGHYDSWFLLPLVAAWLIAESPQRSDSESSSLNVSSVYLQSLVAQRTSKATVDGRMIWSALLVGISIAVKWISLPILGFLAWRSLTQRRWVQLGLVVIVGALPMSIGALQFCSPDACPLIPTGSVFVSHGRSADLIPYLVSTIWEPSRWENWLFVFPLGGFGVWLLWRSPTFLSFTEWYLALLLVLSPIIHGWYFTWLVPFAVASRNWGTRLVSLSAFIYFVLPHRQSLGDTNWLLGDRERLLLWLPFLLGWAVSLNQHRHQYRSGDSRRVFETLMKSVSNIVYRIK